MEPDRLIDEPLAGPDTDEPDVLVRGSDEEIDVFDSRRIIEVLIREAGVDAECAAQIELEVRQFIQKMGFRALTSSMIRGLVDVKLIELGLEEAQRAHGRIGVPFHDVDRLIRGSIPERGSARGPEGTSLLLGDSIKREYALRVFSEQTVNAHLVGDFHIHAIEAIDRPYSVISTIDYVKKNGLAPPHSFSRARPARRAEVLVAHIVKFTAALQGYLSGPVQWDSLNFGLAPFLSGMNEESMRQLAQALVFELSAPAVSRGDRHPLSDLHLDIEAPPYLKGSVALGVQGRETGSTYDRYTEEARSFLKSLLETYAEGDGSGNPFLMPRLFLHLTPRFGAIPGLQSMLPLISRIATDRGGLTLVFERREEAAYRRYGIGQEEAGERRTARLQIISLNFPRVGYLAAGNQVKVFEELTRLVETAAQAHLEKRVFLEKLLAAGERGPLSALASRRGGAPFLRLNGTTHAFSLVGLSELCRAVHGAHVHESRTSMEFALKVLAHVRNEVERLSRKHNVRFILSGLSDGRAGSRLARLDLRFFKEIAAAAVSGDPGSDAAYYTEGPRLAGSSRASLAERIHTEGIFHEPGFVDAVTGFWPGEATVGAEELGGIVSTALSRTSCSGLVFLPEFTVCNECRLVGRGALSVCNACGSNRVEGLASSGERYSRTASWERGRIAELADHRSSGLSMGTMSSGES